MARKIAAFLLWVVVIHEHSNAYQELQEARPFELLPTQLQEALRRADEEGLTVKILTKGLGQDARWVIVLGEKHCCNCVSTSQAGRAVVDEVPLRGVEGYLPKSFITKAACCLLAPCSSCIQCGYQSSCGSLTNYAESTTPGEKTSLLEDGTQHTIKVFRLEEGHQGDLSEDLGMASYVAVALSGAAALVNCAFSSYPVFYASLGVVSYVGLSQMAVFMLEACLPWSMSTSWLRWFGINGLVVARNETMAPNIERIFHNYPDQTMLVVIVGKAHISHLLRLLINEHGYEQVKLS